jgi:hypothetical protein
MKGSNQEIRVKGTVVWAERIESRGSGVRIIEMIKYILNP